MRLGIHGSVRTGLSQALAEADQAGCDVLQMLPYRRHHIPSDEELASFRETARNKQVIVHSRFVPSLASSDETRRLRSVALLKEELRLAAGLGSERYILHAGAYSEGGSAAEGLKLCADSISRASRDFKGTILIENVPGGGRRLCGSLEEIAELRGLLPMRTGVCLDTAHAFAAGYDLSSVEGALKFTAKAFRLFGEAVMAFHLNDTQALLGSRLESHEHWGKGRLGKEGPRTLLQREEFSGVPAIVETPKEPGADRLNLDYLEALRG